MTAPSDPAIPAPGENHELFVDGPAGRLESLISSPKTGQAPIGVCVVCHPHPLFGGTMANKVVYSLASSALKAGLLTARFNFRGVGRSIGRFDEARGETEDVVAVAEWLRARLPGTPLVLAGFSFGAYVSLKAASLLHPAAQLSISVPFGRYVDSAPPPPHPGCPWLAVHSTDDDVVAYAETKAVLDAYAPPPRLVTLEGAGHFYHGRLGDLQQAVQPFLQEALAR